ncbi:MAG: TnsA endonuclease N-terminal domain-containing protein [Dissulfurispiraceae bacterium]
MSVRRITNGGRKVIGKFPSLKMGRAVWWESQLERDYIYYLEVDRDIVSYKEQPLKIRYLLDRKIHHYTPDFLVWRTDKQQIVEVKDEESAGKEEYRHLFHIVAPLFMEEGYEFVVVTEKTIRLRPLLDNLKLLHKYSRTIISHKHQIDAYAFFSSDEDGTLGKLASFLRAKGSGAEIAYALIYWGVIAVDLANPINSQSQVSLADASMLTKEKCA